MLPLPFGKPHVLQLLPSAVLSITGICRLERSHRCVLCRYDPPWWPSDLPGTVIALHGTGADFPVNLYRSAWPCFPVCCPKKDISLDYRFMTCYPNGDTKPGSAEHLSVFLHVVGVDKTTCRQLDCQVQLASMTPSSTITSSCKLDSTGKLIAVGSHSVSLCGQPK